MKNEKIHHKFRGAIIVLLAFAFDGCSNPLLEQMRERITNDVDAYVAGEAPSVLSVLPAANSDSVPSSSAIEVRFDIDLDAATVNAENVRLLRLPGQTAVAGAVSYDAAEKNIRFVPAARLDLETSYRVEIGTALKSAKGAGIGQGFESEFTTRYFHDDEIGIALTYSSADLVLNADAPIYIQVYQVPLPSAGGGSSVAILDDIPVTASGKYRIAQNRIPAGASRAIVVLFHDINGDYAPGGDGAGNGDSERFIKTGIPGNLVEETGDILAGPPVDGFLTLNPDYILDLGNGYAVTFEDGSPIAADGFESADASGPYRSLNQGTYETARNLHSLSDVDYLRFTPSVTNHYAIKVNETPYDLRVELYANDSDALTRSNLLASSTGTAARIVNASAYAMTGGQTYYLRVDSPSSGLGPYEIGYFYSPALADVAEGDDDMATAQPLPLGRAAVLARTFHLAEGYDGDWYELGLEAGKSYIIEVAEQPSAFPGSAPRGLDAAFILRNSSGGSSTDHYVIKANTLYIEALASGGTYFLEVVNSTPVIGVERPTMSYSILATYGPDSADLRDDPYTSGTDEYALYNEHGPEGAAGTASAIPLLPRTPLGIRRTIYSALDGEDPEDDVDWFRIRANDNMNDYLIRTESEPGTDGIIVEFDVFRAMQSGPNIVPDTASGIQATGQTWSDTADPEEPTRGMKIQGYVLNGYGASTTHYPTELQGTFFVRVRRSTASAVNPLSGAYRFFFRAGGDDEDNQGPDTAVTVGATPYRLDETPWIGQPIPLSTDFSDRNKLAIASEWLSNSTPMRYKSIDLMDYNFSTGKPDGTAPGPDHDYFWVEIPAGFANASLIVTTAHENYPVGMPIKVTVYKAPNVSAGSAIATIQARDANSDVVVTEGELVLTGTFDSQDYFTTYGDHQIFEDIAGLSGGDVLFFRVERDTANAGPSDPESTEYSIRMMHF